MAKIFFIFVSAVLALYFFLYAKNSVYAAISIGTSLVLFYIFITAWPRPVPIVQIDDEGIRDRRLGFVIRWQDLVDAQIEVHGPFLCLRVKDPEDYISLLPPQVRENMKFHQSLGFKMLNLDMKAVDVDLLTLLNLVRQKIKETQNS